MNEFYTVILYSSKKSFYFFKDKEKAFSFLWQEFLNHYAHKSDKFIQKAKNELNEDYRIIQFGEIRVCDFED